MYRQNKPDKFKYINELKQKHCYLDYRLYFSTYIEHLVPVIIALHNEGLWKRHGRNWESNIRNCVFNSPEHAEKLSNALINLNKADLLSQKTINLISVSPEKSLNIAQKLISVLTGNEFNIIPNNLLSESTKVLYFLVTHAETISEIMSGLNKQQEDILAVIRLLEKLDILDIDKVRTLCSYCDNLPFFLNFMTDLEKSEVSQKKVLQLLCNFPDCLSKQCLADFNRLLNDMLNGYLKDEHIDVLFNNVSLLPDYLQIFKQLPDLRVPDEDKQSGLVSKLICFILINPDTVMNFLYNKNLALGGVFGTLKWLDKFDVLDIKKIRLLQQYCDEFLLFLKFIENLDKQGILNKKHLEVLFERPEHLHYNALFNFNYLMNTLLNGNLKDYQVEKILTQKEGFLEIWTDIFEGLSQLKLITEQNVICVFANSNHLYLFQELLSKANINPDDLTRLIEFLQTKQVTQDNIEFLLDFDDPEVFCFKGYQVTFDKIDFSQLSKKAIETLLNCEKNNINYQTCSISDYRKITNSQHLIKLRTLLNGGTLDLTNIEFHELTQYIANGFTRFNHVIVNRNVLEHINRLAKELNLDKKITLSNVEIRDVYFPTKLGLDTIRFQSDLAFTNCRMKEEHYNQFYNQGFRNFNGVDFSQCDMNQCDFSGSSFKDAKLTGASLSAEQVNYLYERGWRDVFDVDFFDKGVSFEEYFTFDTTDSKFFSNNPVIDKLESETNLTETVKKMGLAFSKLKAVAETTQIYLNSVSMTKPTYEKRLFQIDATVFLPELGKLIKQLDIGNNNRGTIEQIIQLLKDRWQLIQGSDICYTLAHNEPVNQIFIQVTEHLKSAGYIGSFVKTLMPSLRSYEHFALFTSILDANSDKDTLAFGNFLLTDSNTILTKEDVIEDIKYAINSTEPFLLRSENPPRPYSEVEKARISYLYPGIGELFSVTEHALKLRDIPPENGTSLLAELRTLREGLRYADAAHNGVEIWWLNQAHESVYAVIGRYSEFWNSLPSALQTTIRKLPDFNFFHAPLFDPNQTGGWGKCIALTGSALETFISKNINKILEIDKTINNDINAQKFGQTRDLLIKKCDDFLNKAPLEINLAQTGYIQPHKKSTFSESHINARTGINSEGDSMQIIGNLIKFVTAEVTRLTRQTSGTLIKDKISQYKNALTQLTELHSHKESVTPAELKKCLDAVSRASDYNTSKVRRSLVKAGIFSESSLARNTTSHDEFESLKTEIHAATENLNFRIQ